ncbi:hypothetical protein ACFVYJ_08375 [Pontibacter sp. JAM-7]|uniref:hypothetical protein n=1 Tax=Pontibacter sp. JAM-7 TaxID=3366581 RepID=UPI003AF8F5FF
MTALPRGAQAICDLFECEIITQLEVCPITLGVVRVYALGMHPDPIIGEAGFVLTDYFKSEAGLHAYCLTDEGLATIAKVADEIFPDWDAQLDTFSQLA